MTSFHRLTALKAITLGAALSMTAGFAFAGDNVSTEDLRVALQRYRAFFDRLLKV